MAFDEGLLSFYIYKILNSYNVNGLACFCLHLLYAINQLITDGKG